MDSNASSDIVMLADVCGMFGLVCFTLLFTSFTLYVALALWRYNSVKDRDGGGIPFAKPLSGRLRARARSDDEEQQHHTLTGKASPLSHGVTHLAVIMDGNRRFGKRISAQAEEAVVKEDRAAAIETLCREMCFDEGPTEAPPLSLPAGVAPSTGSRSLSYNRAWLNDRYRYFLSLIRSTALDGHREGGEKLIEFIRYCIEAGIRMLTVYAFSTDNWRRPAHEVDALMTLFFFFFDKIRQTARQDGIFVRFVSTNPELLPPRICALMVAIEKESRTVTPRRITVNVCVSYGGQQEVLGACNRVLARRAATLQPHQPITQADLDAEMLRSMTQGDHEEEDRERVFSTLVPREPQLVLRTSGEQRISNFLLYELAYSELFFSPKTWPELTQDDLLDALQQYACRDRRGGK